jgi:hypothetical protein
MQGKTISEGIQPPSSAANRLQRSSNFMAMPSNMAVELSDFCRAFSQAFLPRAPAPHWPPDAHLTQTMGIRIATKNRMAEKSSWFSRHLAERYRSWSSHQSNGVSLRTQRAGGIIPRRCALRSASAERDPPNTARGGWVRGNAGLAFPPAARSPADSTRRAEGRGPPS